MNRFLVLSIFCLFISSTGHAGELTDYEDYIEADISLQDLIAVDAILTASKRKVSICYAKDSTGKRYRARSIINKFSARRRALRRCQRWSDYPESCIIQRCKNNKH